MDAMRRLESLRQVVTAKLWLFVMAFLFALSQANLAEYRFAAGEDGPWDMMVIYGAVPVVVIFATHLVVAIIEYRFARREALIRYDGLHGEPQEEETSARSVGE